MKPIFCCLFFLFAGLSSHSQVKSILLDKMDQITTDSTQAITYAVYGKLSGDSLYTFKKFDFNGIMLTTGSFLDDSLHIPHGTFVYYDWITPANNNANLGYDINGKERFIALTGKFIRGVKNGRWIAFYPDGKIKQILTFSQGAFNGAYEFFDTSGKLEISGLYLLGKKNGTWIMRGGRQEDEYVNDKLVSSLTGKKLRDKQAAGQKNTN